MSGAGGFPDGLFAGRRFAVLGLGRNGLPAAERLAALGADVVAWDDGSAARDAARAAGIEVALPSDLSGFSALVLSPGIAHVGRCAHPVAREAGVRGVPVLSDAALLFEAVRASGSRARFAGVTGTNGKSTTTVLLAHLLREGGIEVAAGGNLGPAALSLPLLGNDGVYVLEMSSYMLERVPGMRFDAAVLLNLSADHLDRHGDMAGYARVKLRIFDGQEPGDLALFGVDDDATVALRGGSGMTVSGAGRTADWSAAGGVLRGPNEQKYDLRGARALRGAHNHQNAAAAVAMALHLGVDAGAIGTALATFGGLAHRQKLVAVVDGVEFVDDSKATNADAAARALGCVDRCVWIAGGQAKAGGIEALAPLFGRVARALLIGQDAEMLAATLAANGVAYEIAGSLERAVPAAFAVARRDGIGTVLLSPACASFDQFRDFEARGRAFAALASALDAGRTEARVA